LTAPEPEQDEAFQVGPDGNPSWRVTRTLRDGTVVTLRPIVPDDAEEIRRGWQALSPRSRYLRFMSLAQEPSENVLHYLTHVDQKDHVAIGATIPSPDLKTERGIGVARFVRLAGSNVAEAAITVADDMQRKGLGTILAHELERAARARGIRTIRAEVHEDNVVVQASLENSGATRLPASSGAGAIAYDIDLGERASTPPSLPSVFREIAKTVTELLAPATDGDDRDRAERESDAGGSGTSGRS
jgi:RimJ/RimL family protein N-acetyltransferase